jgi:putative DNA primase/helicase
MRAAAPEPAELLAIIEAMPVGRFTAREIGTRVALDQTLREVLESFAGRNGTFSTKRFGRYLLRNAGTRVGGKWIEQVENDGTHGAIWRVCGSEEAEW